ncbi:MAG: biopolymer transporter ExbD [Bryobacteraceae bacterium]
MMLGSRGGPRAEINMTPMIDVLLVLLIIFLVITPLKPVGLPAQAPQPSPDSAPSEPVPGTLVIHVRQGGELEVNTRRVTIIELPQKLHTEFHARKESTIFIQAEPDLEFAAVAKVIDITRGAGIERVGLMPGNAVLRR